MNRKDVVSLIITAAEDLRKERKIALHDPIAESTVLFGRNGIFDSLGLVSLIVDVEQRIEDRDLSIILGDERAVSQKHSPFRTVQSLAEYIGKLIDEQQHVRT